MSKWLRILGFDAAYFDQQNFGSLVIVALRESRVIITRNQRLAGHRGVRVVLIKAERIKEQIQETLQQLGIQPDPKNMFSRCILCNEELTMVEKSVVKEKVPEYVFNTQETFITCRRCKRVYWRGTHWGNVRKILEEIGG